MSDIFSDKSIGRISSLLTEPQSGAVREGLVGRSQSFSSNNDALSKILNIIIASDSNFSVLYNADYLTHANFLLNIKMTTHTHS